MAFRLIQPYLLLLTNHRAEQFEANLLKYNSELNLLITVCTLTNLNAAHHARKKLIFIFINACCYDVS
jgi:hypothetical protein